MKLIRRKKQEKQVEIRKSKVYIDVPDVPEDNIQQYDAGNIIQTQETTSQPVAHTPTCPSIQLDSTNTKEQSDCTIKDMVTGKDRKGRIPMNAVIEALHKSNGLITIAAKLLKCDYETVARYIKDNKKVQQTLFIIEEGIKDKVQSKLFAAIDKGDKSAMYFYLKCKAKDRGFIESEKYIQPPNVPITFNYKVVYPNYPDALVKDKVLEITQEQALIEDKDKENK